MKKLDNRNGWATEGPGSVIMRRGGIPGDRRECVEWGDGHRAPSKMFHVKRPTIPSPKPAHQGGRSPHLRRKHVLPDAGRSVRDGPHPAAPGLIDGPFTHAGAHPPQYPHLPQWNSVPTRDPNALNPSTGGPPSRGPEHSIIVRNHSFSDTMMTPGSSMSRLVLKPRALHTLSMGMFSQRTCPKISLMPRLRA